MKTLEELEVGRWYQCSYWGSSRDYAKCSKIDNETSDELHFEEKIVKGEHAVYKDWWSFKFSRLREVPLEEIQQYLPDGHPDKIVTPIFKKGDLVRVLKESHGWGIIKPGDVGIVNRIDDKCLYVKFEKTCYPWTGTFECFELVSEKSSTKELTELPEKWMVKVTTKPLASKESFKLNKLPTKSWY